MHVLLKAPNKPGHTLDPVRSGAKIAAIHYKQLAFFFFFFSVFGLAGVGS